MADLRVDIVSAEGNIHQGETVMVFAPAEMGEVGSTTRHAPLLTRLKPGEVRVKTPEGEDLQFFVGGGILEVQPHLVTVLADTAERAQDMDGAQAEEAKQRAKEALEGKNADMDYSRAAITLAEASARLRTIEQIKKMAKR